MWWTELVLTCIGRVARARFRASFGRSLPEFGCYTRYDGIQCSLAQLDGLLGFVVGHSERRETKKKEDCVARGSLAVA